MFAQDKQALAQLLQSIEDHGAKVPEEINAETEPCPADGVLPDLALNISVPSRIRVNGEWVPVKPNNNGGGDEYAAVVDGDNVYLERTSVLKGWY